MNFYSNANKTHFPKKGFALTLILKERNSEMADSKYELQRHDISTNTLHRDNVRSASHIRIAEFLKPFA